MASKVSSGAELRVIETLTAEDVQVLTTIINKAYNIGEKGFWVPQWTRTTTSEIATLVGEGKLVGAFLSNRIAGCIRTSLVSDKEAEFGMLAVEDSLWGSGLGRELVQFVEDMWMVRGVKKLHLEIVVPRTWISESKEVLKGWYGRRGYMKGRVGKLDELEGTEVFLRQLSTEVDVVYYTKILDMID